jgi:hypothetical protein
MEPYSSILDEEDKYMKATTMERHHKRLLFVDEATLANKRWGVGVKMANETIKATAQNYVRNSMHP